MADDLFQRNGGKRPGVLAVVNTLTADRAMRNLEGINRARAEELLALIPGEQRGVMLTVETIGRIRSSGGV